MVQELSYPPTSMTVGHNFLAAGGQQGQVRASYALPKKRVPVGGTNEPHGAVYSWTCTISRRASRCTLVPWGTTSTTVRASTLCVGFWARVKELISRGHGTECAALHVGRSRAGEMSLLVSNNDCTIKVLNLPTLQTLASFSFPVAINYSAMVRVPPAPPFDSPTEPCDASAAANPSLGDAVAGRRPPGVRG